MLMKLTRCVATADLMSPSYRTFHQLQSELETKDLRLVDSFLHINAILSLKKHKLWHSSSIFGIWIQLNLKCLKMSLYFSKNLKRTHHILRTTIADWSKCKQKNKQIKFFECRTLFQGTNVDWWRTELQYSVGGVVLPQQIRYQKKIKDIFSKIITS